MSWIQKILPKTQSNVKGNVPEGIWTKCSKQSAATHALNVPNVSHVPNVPNTNIVPRQHCDIGKVLILVWDTTKLENKK